MSESKKIKELQVKLKKLEKLNEQKQMEIEFKEKMIEIASQIYGIDFERIRSKASGGSGLSEKNTDGK